MESVVELRCSCLPRVYKIFTVGRESLIHHITAHSALLLSTPVGAGKQCRFLLRIPQHDSSYMPNRYLLSSTSKTRSRYFHCNSTA